MGVPKDGVQQQAKTAQASSKSALSASMIPLKCLSSWPRSSLAMGSNSIVSSRAATRFLQSMHSASVRRKMGPAR